LGCCRTALTVAERPVTFTPFRITAFRSVVFVVTSMFFLGYWLLFVLRDGYLLQRACMTGFAGLVPSHANELNILIINSLRRMPQDGTGRDISGVTGFREPTPEIA
jgi:hypothetical protein